MRNMKGDAQALSLAIQDLLSRDLDDSSNNRVIGEPCALLECALNCIINMQGRIDDLETDIKRLERSRR